ncbi:MAG: M17 family peptidase N-terminal domain-containing protein [Myxococcales bacterium]|nr:leucyl aminopeptidase [Polyangiaceae bacterium]MDW8250504.1 M17 family peptidase N-terminal domain-containing protein [Myxococcales bacterium]
MELHFVTPELRRLDELPTEALACCLHSDILPPRGVAGLLSWRFAGRIERLLEAGFLTGQAGEVLLLSGRPRLTADKVLLFGLGLRSSFDEAAFDRVVEHILDTLSGLCIRSAVLELPGRPSDALPPEQAADRFLACVARHGDAFDSFVLVEPPIAQRRIDQHMIEERRRIRRL